MKPGTRVRLAGPWPERVGCEGVVVDPAIFAGVYPGDKRTKGDLIVKLDNDPLHDSRWAHDDRWTCVVELEDVEEVSCNPSEEGSDG